MSTGTREKHSSSPVSLDHLPTCTDQGHPDATALLADMFREGNGVVQDDVRAFELYTQSALQGECSSQHNVGLMYVN